jgi:Family of unknown function (DUF5681)
MPRKSQFQKDGSKDKPQIPKAASPSGPAGEEEYRVGPGRPPKEHQFRPGRSGNPKGAKRKTPSLAPDLKEIFERALNQKAQVTQGERKLILTMFEAGMEQLVVQLAKGDRHARRDVFWIAEKLGCELLPAKKASDETLADDHQAILDAYVARQIGPKASSASAPILEIPELLDDDTDEADKK